MDRSPSRSRTAVRWIAGLFLAGTVVVFPSMRSPADEPALEESPSPGTYRLVLEDQNRERTALVRVPRGYRAGEHPPLLIVLHGAGGSGEHVLRNDGWERTADEAGYLLVAPDGLPARMNAEPNLLTNPRLWNSGQLRAGSPRTRVDDVAYIRHLLTDLESKIAFDRQHVFVAGHSNGAGMSFQLASEMANEITGIAVVAGEVVDRPHPARPVPTLAIFGTADEVRPLAGGESELPWGSRTTEPVEAELARWAEAINCETDPVEISHENSTRVVHYPSKNNGAELKVMYLEGHGHAWPGAQRGRLLARLLGPVNAKIDANNEIVKFFQSLPELPNPPQPTRRR